MLISLKNKNNSLPFLKNMEQTNGLLFDAGMVLKVKANDTPLGRSVGFCLRMTNYSKTGESLLFMAGIGMTRIVFQLPENKKKV